MVPRRDDLSRHDPARPGTTRHLQLFAVLPRGHVVVGMQAQRSLVELILQLGHRRASIRAQKGVGVREVPLQIIVMQIAANYRHARRATRHAERQ